MLSVELNQTKTDFDRGFDPGPQRVSLYRSPDSLAGGDGIAAPLPKNPRSPPRLFGPQTSALQALLLRASSLLTTFRCRWSNYSDFRGYFWASLRKPLCRNFDAGLATV